MTIQEISTILTRAGWAPGSFTLRQSLTNTLISLSTDLARSTPALGGNAAGALVTTLNCAGWIVTPEDWKHLLSGKESMVTRCAWTTLEVATLRHGNTVTRNQVNTTGQWLHRKTQPVNSGARPLLWPVDAVEVALAEEQELFRSGRRNPGNQTRGESRRGRKRKA